MPFTVTEHLHLDPPFLVFGYEPLPRSYNPFTVRNMRFSSLSS